MPERFVHAVLFGPVYLISLICVLTVSALAQPQPQADLSGKSVLVLHAWEANLPMSTETNKALSRVFNSGGLPAFSQSFECLDLRRNPGPEYKKLLTEKMRLQYRHRKPDLIIAVNPIAMRFATDDCRDVFADIPILALMLPTGFQVPKTGRRVISHFPSLDIVRTLDIALNLVPHAKRVYIANGSYETDIAFENQVRRVSKKWEGRLQFLYLSSMPFEDMLAAVSKAPPDSVVLTLGFAQDVSGKLLTTPTAIRRLSEVSSAPVFGIADVALGYGIVGGFLSSYDFIGTKAGELVLNILKGVKTPGSIPDVLDVATVPMFDWRQLRRWKLSEAALPKGSIIINKETTLWDFKYYIIGALALCLAETGLIIFLVVQRRRKKSAEESLRQRTEELDQFFNVSLDLLGIANTEGYFLRVNPAAERILGYSREELMSEQFFDFVHPDDLDRTRKALSSLTSQQKVFFFENRYRCKDGTYRWLQWNAVPAGDLIYSSARDVTEQKQVEEALRESQEEAQRVAREALVRAEVGRVIGSTLTIEEVYESFATVVKSVIPFDRIVISTIDSEKGVFEVAYAAGAKFEDREAGKVYGLEGTGIAEMLRTKSSFLLQTGDSADYQGRFPGLLSTFQAGFQSILDIPLVTRGTVIGALLLRSFKPEAYTEEHVQLAVRIGNQIAGAIANAQLFSKQKRTEEALRESEERFRQVAESVGDFIWEVDAAGLYRYTSPSVEKILGYTPDELIGKKHFYDLFAPEVREWLKEAAFEVFAAKGSFRALPNPNISKEGKVVDLETSGVPILDAGGNLAGYRGADTDVTERKMAEQAVEERLRFERLLSDLSARFVNISHDRVDFEIERGLRKILDFFQVDRCGLVRTLPGRMTWEITHVATAEGVPMIPQRTGLPVSIRPWAFEKLVLKHEVVSFSKIDDLPAEANADRQGHIEWGVKSTLNIPIITGGPVDHILAINSVKSERIWPEELIQRLRLLGEILVNALERKQTRLQIEERLRFEGLISTLSAGFVNLSPDEVDSEINKGLRSITEFFDADRCTIGLFTEDGTQLSPAFEYRSAVAEPAVESLWKEQMPWYVEQLMSGKPVVINRVEDLPPEADKERQLCLARGMKSVLSMPMVSGGVPLGACALVSTRAERVWPEELVMRFRLVSEVFANALKGKRADTLLQASEEKFRQFFAHTPEFCYIVSTEGVILDVNDWALQGLGYEREDLIGKPLATVYAPESIPKMKDLFAGWKEKGEIKNEEMVVLTKKGEKRTVLLNVGAVRNKDGAIIHSASIQTDITERKRAEAEVNRAREQLLHVERSARMGELTASLAHELNQPLAAILSNAQAALRFLQSDKANLDELREILQDIIQDDQRAGNVIRSLRSMMKREEREKAPIILNGIVNDVTQIFHAESIFRNVHIDTAFDESLPPVLGDKVQLQQVVLNLIVNAADAMSQNPPEDRKISMRTQAKNGRIRVMIRDFGPGIDQESLERIFQPFFTTKKTGLGMGLAVCQTIVEAHDGHIWAENNPDGGATFFMEIPIYKRDK